MSALTSIFNFLYVYLRYFMTCLLGGLFDIRHFANEEQISIAKQIVLIATGGYHENGIFIDSHPFLLLFVAIFVLGAIIGLIRRLMR